MFDKVITDKEGKVKRTYLTISIICVITGILASVFYRKYINSTKVYDLGLADFLPSFLFVLGIINFALLASYGNHVRGKIKIIIAISIGALLYEFEQLFTSRIFDIIDVVGILLGSLVSLFIYYFVEKKSTVQHLPNRR